MKIEWINDRWHLDGRGIHAGDFLELKVDTGWQTLRVESRDCGRKLDGYLYVNDGPPFIREIDPDRDVLRWTLQA